MHAATEPPVPPDLEILPVAHFPEYVLGFPIHVVMTVRARPDVSFNHLPFPDFLNLRSTIDVDIEGKIESQPQRRLKKQHIDPESGRKGSRLGAGEARRMLIDLSQLLDGELREGEYAVRISYVETDGAHQAAPIKLRFRRPNAEEAALLIATAPDRLNFDDWGMWTITCPAGIVHEGPISPDNPLRFNLVLRSLICSSVPLDQIQPSILDTLTGLYEPEADALKAELYQARGDHASYQGLRLKILRSAPGLIWWVRMIDSGGAFLKSLKAR